MSKKSYLQNIEQHKNLFIDKFSENHLIVLGINNFINSDDNLKTNKYFNSLVLLNHKLDILSVYNKIKWFSENLS